MNGQRVQRGGPGEVTGSRPAGIGRHRHGRQRRKSPTEAGTAGHASTQEPVGTRTQPRAQGTELEKGAGAHPEAALLSEAREAAVTRGHSPVRLSRLCPCHSPGDKSPNGAVPVP